MADSKGLLERRQRVVCPGIGRFHTATAATAKGATVTDADGRALIDFAGGIGVMNVGHGDPDVLRAIREQSERLTHACIHVATYEPYVALCERLASLLPHGRTRDEGTKVALFNSGAEAVENAIKIARQATGRPAVIAFTEGFHGRTMMAMTLTSKVGYKLGCGPYAPEVYRLPFPNRYKFGDGLPEDEFVRRELRRLRHALSSMVAPDQVAAIIIEPVQGEGGFVVAPPGYLRGLRELCDEHGIALVIDEVQTGFGRTGRWAAYQHAGITPDISTWAKSMGGGMPIAAVVGRAGVMDKARPGTIGGTYGGNPVACAAALAAIGVIEKKGLCERAEVIGRRVRQRFDALKTRHPDVVGDVRGLGAMVAMELVERGDPYRPATILAADLLAAALERGLLLISAGTQSNIVRVLAPLVIEDERLERGLDIIEAELGTLVARSAVEA